MSVVKKQFKFANDLLRLGLNESNNQAINKLDSLKGKPFYCWDTSKFGVDTCCFNHIISLPQKDKVEHPLYDYEQLLYHKLFSDSNYPAKENFAQDKHLWVLKSTGLGITEFFLRVIAWLCTKDDSLKGSQVCIVTGPVSSCPSLYSTD